MEMIEQKEENGDKIVRAKKSRDRKKKSERKKERKSERRKMGNNKKEKGRHSK